MKRKHHKRVTSGEHYAMIPDEVLTSDACRTLPNSTHRVLVAIAAQYRGNNGGDLAMTYKMAERYGIKSKKQLANSIAMLIERGLIQKTRQGGKRPLGPCLYALTWKPIDACAGKLDIGPTTAASNAWAAWAPAPPGGHIEINQQHHRGGRSAPPGGQKATVSAPHGGLRSRINGTTGGTPSRVWTEGVPTMKPSFAVVSSRTRHAEVPSDRHPSALAATTLPTAAGIIAINATTDAGPAFTTRVRHDEHVDQVGSLVDSVLVDPDQLTVIDLGIELPVPDLQSQQSYLLTHGTLQRGPKKPTRSTTRMWPVSPISDASYD